MPKRASSPPLVLPPRTRAQTLHEWLGGSLRAAILDGRLRAGRPLPSSRTLAAQYGVARGTVVTAFEQLRSEGYLRGAVGGGTFVTDELPDDLLRVASAPPAPVRARVARRLSRHARRTQLFPGYPERGVRAFHPNLPALDRFPTTLWAQVTGRRLRRATARLLLGSEPLGHRPLREAVAEYLTVSRGARCVAEQVAITTGVQEALALASRLVLEPGARVCMEDPGYIGAARAFAAHGARITPIEVDAEGMRIPAVRTRDVALVYVTPAHQFPLGVAMSLPRRLSLLEWARSMNALVFEDDYDSEYRYAGRPLPAIQGLDAHGSVMLAGSFNKVLFPSLRLGYLVVPADLVSPVEALISVSQRHAPTLSQAVLADFIAEGHFGRHLRRMRQLYAERLGVLLEEAGKRLDGILEVTPIEAGLQIVGWLPPGVGGTTARAAAAAQGVDVTPVSRYAVRSLEGDGLQLGFAALEPAEIRRGASALATALAPLVRKRARR